MRQEIKSKGSNIRKVVLTFLSAGAVSGLLFAALINMRGLESLWFSTREYWIYPTWSYWLAAAFLFIISVLTAYHLSRSRNWLSTPRASMPLIWWLAVLLVAMVPLLIWTSNLPVYGVIFGPLIVSALVILVLFLVSGRWDSLVAVLIFGSNPLVMLIAGIPDLVLNESMSFKQFQSLRSLLGSGLLAGLIGLWLARRKEKSKEPAPENGSSQCSPSMQKTS